MYVNLKDDALETINRALGIIEGICASELEQKAMLLTAVEMIDEAIREEEKK